MGRAVDFDLDDLALGSVDVNVDGPDSDLGSVLGREGSVLILGFDFVGRDDSVRRDWRAEPKSSAVVGRLRSGR